MSNENEKVEHPSHYGGANNPYEAIKVIRAWALGFSLGNAVKYISRAGKKAGESVLVDLKKARWYLNEEIAHQHAEDGEAATQTATAALMLGMREVLCELAYRNRDALSGTEVAHLCKTLKLRSVEPRDVAPHVPTKLLDMTSDERKAWAANTLDAIMLDDARPGAQ